SGAGGPSADELAQRFAERDSRTAKEAPASLGPPAPPPPDPSGLPPGVARVMQAIGIALGELFGSSEAAHDENLLRGLARSGGAERTAGSWCGVSPPAAAGTKGRRAVSRARPSSIASSRATCSSRSRRPRRST